MNYQQFVIGAVTTADNYPYLAREMQKPLHPVFVVLLDHGLISDTNAGELTREWPHVSKDGKRVAFTDDIDKGEVDRQLVTNISDYLRRYI